MASADRAASSTDHGLLSLDGPRGAVRASPGASNNSVQVGCIGADEMQHDVVA